MLNAGRLRVLNEVAARGSIAAAADALWLTPSAVSQQLTVLERETATELIDRTGRLARLTPAGQVLVERGALVMEALADAEAAMRSLAHEPHGRLRVASFPSVVGGVLAPALARLSARHPDLAVELEDLEGRQALDAVAAGRVDVAVVDTFGWGVGARRPDLESVELFGDPLVAVLPARHPLAACPRVEWAELASERWMVEQSSSLFCDTVLAECRRAGFEPDVAARVHDLLAQLELIEAGCGVAVLPRLAVAGGRWRVAVRPLSPALERRLVAFVRPGCSGDPAVSALLSAAQDR